MIGPNIEDIITINIPSMPKGTTIFDLGRVVPIATESKKMSEYIMGVDEAGMGCLVGDVIAAAVCLPQKSLVHNRIVDGVKDSKKLSEKRRIEIFNNLMSAKIPFWFGIRSPEFIDKYGIAAAKRACMSDAINMLLHTEVREEKWGDVDIRIDGNPTKLSIPEEPQVSFIVRGDDKDWLIGAASIIAKVLRDDIMIELDAKYPAYGFKNNKGYGSAPIHIAAIKQFGITPYHRKSFRIPGEERSRMTIPNLLR